MAEIRKAANEMVSLADIVSKNTAVTLGGIANIPGVSSQDSSALQQFIVSNATTSIAIEKLSDGTYVALDPANGSTPLTYDGIVAVKQMVSINTLLNTNPDVRSAVVSALTNTGIMSADLTTSSGKYEHHRDCCVGQYVKKAGIIRWIIIAKWSHSESGNGR